MPVILDPCFQVVGDDGELGRVAKDLEFAMRLGGGSSHVNTLTYEGNILVHYNTEECCKYFKVQGEEHRAKGNLWTQARSELRGFSSQIDTHI